MPLFLQHLIANNRLSDMELTVCLVGSRTNDQHDPFATQAWPMLGRNLRIIGFEADVECCRKMNEEVAAKKQAWREEHYPVALWSNRGRQTLHVTKAESASSLFPPSRDFLARFADVERWFTVMRTVEVETTTMDEFFANNPAKIDFLQIDVQGGELEVMRGGQSILARDALAVVAEVEWNEMYEGQTLYGEVDVFMRKIGMSLFDVSPVNPYFRRGIPFRTQNHPGMPGWSNATYMRDLVRSDTPQNRHLQSPHYLLKLACIADILDFPDYALEVLIHLTKTHGSDPRFNFAHDILGALRQVPQIAAAVPHGIPALAQLAPFLSQGR
jgi:FkbM family methyltransferase